MDTFFFTHSQTLKTNRMFSGLLSSSACELGLYNCWRASHCPTYSMWWCNCTASTCRNHKNHTRLLELQDYQASEDDYSSIHVALSQSDCYSCDCTTLLNFMDLLGVQLLLCYSKLRTLCMFQKHSYYAYPTSKWSPLQHCKSSMQPHVQLQHAPHILSAFLKCFRLNCMTLHPNSQYPKVLQHLPNLRMLSQHNCSIPLFLVY